MTDFEQALENCLRDLERGDASLEECLARYPEHAAQLQAILSTTTRLRQARKVQAPAAFTMRLRTQVKQHMEEQAYRQKPSLFPWARLAIGLAVVVVALLVTGTAYAQKAVPGDALYGWKLASENTWRALSADPVGTDLLILDRRADELVEVSDAPALHAQALRRYLEVSTRLRAEMNAETSGAK